MLRCPCQGEVLSPGPLVLRELYLKLASWLREQAVCPIDREGLTEATLTFNRLLDEVTQAVLCILLRYVASLLCALLCSLDQMIDASLVVCPFSRNMETNTKRPCVREDYASPSSVSSSCSSSVQHTKTCAWTGPLSTRKAHLDRDCALALLPCPLNAYGCAFQMVRGDLDAHATAAALLHVDLLVKHSVAQEKKIDHLQATLLEDAAVRLDHAPTISEYMHPAQIIELMNAAGGVRRRAIARTGVRYLRVITCHAEAGREDEFVQAGVLEALLMAAKENILCPEIVNDAIQSIAYVIHGDEGRFQILASLDGAVAVLVDVTRQCSVFAQRLALGILKDIGRVDAVLIFDD